jgi:hypothetical protein
VPKELINPFYKDLKEYKRDFYPLKHYIHQASYYLSLMTGIDVKIAEYFKEDNKKDENLIVDNVDYNIEIDIPISDERFVSKMFENIKEYSVITAYEDNWRPKQDVPQ